MPRSIATILILLAALGASPDVAAATASLTMIFTNNGEPLEDPTNAKFYIYEHEKRDSYLAWGHGAKVARAPEGVYDVVIRYHNDQIFEERVLEEFVLAGDVEHFVDYDIPIARLTVRITSGGEPIPVHGGRFSIYPAARRGEPLVSRRPGETVTIRPGSYDIEVVFRDHRGLQSTWLDAYDLEGDRFESVEFGPAAARFKLTFVEDGRPLAPDRARWRVFEPGRRLEPLAEGGSGDEVELPAGVYDVGLFYRRGRRDVERWIEGIELRGEVRREIDVSGTPASVRIDIRHGGSLLSSAWYTVHPAGDETTVVASGMSGVAVEVEPGVYDIACFHRDRGVQAERWLRAENVSERFERDVELDFRPASLRVNPGRRSREPSNLLLIVDSSAAMRDQLGGRSKLELARLGIKSAASHLRGADLRLGVRAYGITPASRRDCRDSALLIPPERPDQARLSSTLDLLRPSGLASIAYSLDVGSTDLPVDGRNSLVLVAGGGEECSRDPCASASRLLRRGLVERIYVVGLGIPRDRHRELSCVGEFYPVSGRSQLRSTLQHIFREVGDNDRGTVSVFRPDGGGWVTSGLLGQKLELAAGKYDVVIHSAGERYEWTGVEIDGDIESPARDRP